MKDDSKWRLDLVLLALSALKMGLFAHKSGDRRLAFNLRPMART